MPHFIIEYSHSLDAQCENITDTVHQVALTCGLFSPEKIRTRSQAYTCHRTPQSHFIHVTIRLFAGRSDANKKALTEQVIQSLSSLDLSDTVVSCECVDIHEPTYCQTSLP